MKRGQYVAPASELPIPQKGELEGSKRDKLKGEGELEGPRPLSARRIHPIKTGSTKTNFVKCAKLVNLANYFSSVNCPSS